MKVYILVEQSHSWQGSLSIYKNKVVGVISNGEIANKFDSKENTKVITMELDDPELLNRIKGVW